MKKNEVFKTQYDIKKIVQWTHLHVILRKIVHKEIQKKNWSIDVKSGT